MNSVVQGSAADLMKRAMVDWCRWEEAAGRPPARIVAQVGWETHLLASLCVSVQVLNPPCAARKGGVWLARGKGCVPRTQPSPRPELPLPPCSVQLHDELIVEVDARLVPVDWVAQVGGVNR